MPGAVRGGMGGGMMNGMVNNFVPMGMPFGRGAGMMPQRGQMMGGGFGGRGAGMMGAMGMVFYLSIDFFCSESLVLQVWA